MLGSALLALLAAGRAARARREPLGRLRHGRRAPPASARSPARCPSSPMSRCVTARSQPGPEAADADAALEQPLAQAGLVGDRDEVRLDGRGVEPDPFGEPPRARVVVGEPLDVVVERVEHRGRGDARLAQRAAEEELPLPRALDRLRRAGEDRAERAAEPLREADRDGVGERSPRPSGSMPAATEALKRRAPSRWTAAPRSRAASTAARNSSSGQIRPPELRCVFSSTSTLPGPSSSTSSICSGVGLPASATRPCMTRPEWIAGPPHS